jgi:hypothetical protein
MAFAPFNLMGSPHDSSIDRDSQACRVTSALDAVLRAIDHTHYFVVEAPSSVACGAHAVTAKLVAGGASGGNPNTKLVASAAPAATAYTCPPGPMAGDESPPPCHCKVATGANVVTLCLVAFRERYFINDCRSR